MSIFLFKTIFLLSFNYSCPHFSPIALPCPAHPPYPTFNPPLPYPFGFVHRSLYMFFDLTLFLLSLLSLSPPFPSGHLVCSLFPCLWLYFVCLLVLLIRFHLQVRSYSVYLSPSGFFHLA